MQQEACYRVIPGSATILEPSKPLFCCTFSQFLSIANPFLRVPHQLFGSLGIILGTLHGLPRSLGKSKTAVNPLSKCSAANCGIPDPVCLRVWHAWKQAPCCTFSHF